ncbi:MAG: glycosyltransferase family 2 protein [Actinobacteria bacterium]|nr:glycosyltransferase family 2 protein [Actinomycetota bacterium]
MTDGVRASILVCTRNRADLLAGCLESILADRSAVPRELIVVDNGSSDGTGDVVRRVVGDRPETPVRYVRELRPGKSAALNTGVALTRGDFVLLTDDDVLVEDGWADALVSGFSGADVGGVAGRILPRWPSSPPRWMAGPHAERVTLPDFGTRPRLLESSEHPVGANLALRAELLRAGGDPFHPTLGPSGQLKLDGEEFHLLRRVRARHRIAYRPEALVFHRILPDRMSWSSMRRAWFQGGFGIARSERLERGTELSLPRRLVRSARTYAGARRLRKRNEGLADPGPADAWEEFSAYAWAGTHLELLFGRIPPLANWIAKRLA